MKVSRAIFNGDALLREQTDMLSRASPTDINYLHFLRIRLSAQQKSTAQRNQLNKAMLAWEDEEDAHTNRSWSQANREGSSSRFDVTHTAAGAMMSAEVAVISPDVGPMHHPQRGNIFSFNTDSSRLPSHFEEVPTPMASRSFEELPASVANRRSMDRHNDEDYMTGPSSLRNTIDEMPAVAQGRSAAQPLSEQPESEVELAPCPHCGRSFAPGRLDRHVAICVKQRDRDDKRKPKDSVRNSRQDTEGSLSGSFIEQRDSMSKRKIGVSARGGEDDRVPCPCCGRRFGAEAAARHIAFCSKSARN